MDVDYLRSRWSVNRNGTILLLEDEMVDSMVIANSPLTVASIVVGYLIFATKLGPKLMESQKPYEVKKIMMFYNLFQIAYNIWLVYLFFKQGGITYLVENVCHPPNINPRRLELVVGIYYYFISKLIDLMDTVFMVLRKKSNQISALQLFHHSTMVISVWISLKFIRDQAGLALGVLNAAIHIVMYSYYYLACLGPAIQKYLWWKKYLTIIQMSQFVIGVIFVGGLMCLGCEIHQFYTYMWSGNLVAMLMLFAHFYCQAYAKNKSKKAE